MLCTRCGGLLIKGCGISPTVWLKGISREPDVSTVAPLKLLSHSFDIVNPNAQKRNEWRHCYETRSLYD